MLSICPQGVVIKISHNFVGFLRNFPTNGNSYRNAESHQRRLHKKREGAEHSTGTCNCNVALANRLSFPAKISNKVMKSCCLFGVYLLSTFTDVKTKFGMTLFQNKLVYIM